MTFMFAIFAQWNSLRIAPALDFLRALMTTGTIALSLNEQTVLGGVGSAGAPESYIIEGLRQGGLLAVILIVLFFYRRDYNKLTDFYKDQNAQMFGMVRDNTKAQADVASALAQNTVVVHQAKQVMSQHFPSRRDEDYRP